jgi:hypothetical protein
MSEWKQRIETLKYLIAKSKDGDEIVKRILFFLIDNSYGLTEEVSMTLTQDQLGYAGQEIDTAARALGKMMSVKNSTHVNEIMSLVGAGLRFSTHYGNYSEDGEFDTEGMFPGYRELAPGHENDRADMPLRYTFWLAREYYGRGGPGKQLTPPTREVLMAINVAPPKSYVFTCKA